MTTLASSTIGFNTTLTAVPVDFNTTLSNMTLVSLLVLGNDFIDDTPDNLVDDDGNQLTEC